MMTTTVTFMLRCWRCDKKLAERVTPPYEIECSRCHAKNKNDKGVDEWYLPTNTA